MKKLIVISCLFFSTLAQAETYNYKCFSYYWNGDTHEKGTLDLTVNLKKANATLIGENGQIDDKAGGSRNIKYKSKGSIKYAKFGYSLIVEEALLTGGRILKDGSFGGFARFEGEAEGGFFQYKFVCKSR